MPLSIEMKKDSVNTNQRKISLFSGSVFHSFHDGIADGLVVFLPLWQVSFGLSLTHIGLLITCFEGATGIFQIPAGILGERYGERILLVCGTLITAVSFMCLGIAEGLISLGLLLFIGGVGSAVQHPLASAMVSKGFYDNGRRVALGTYNFSGDIGKFLFPALAALVLSQIGWHLVCAGFGLIGCLLAVIIFFILRSARVGDRFSDSNRHKGALKSNGWGINNKGAFGILSVIGILDTAVRIALVTFGPFLFIQKGIEAESVGFALSILFVGGAAGKFICGFLAERIGIVATVVITEGLTGCGIFLLAILPLPYIYLFLPFLGVALNGTSSVLYGTVADFVDSNKVARAFGLFYTFVIGSAAVAPLLMGRISDVLGVEDSINLIGWVALTTIPMAFALSRQTVKLSREEQCIH